LFPKLISIDTFFLPTYGVMVALGFLAALWLTGKLARRSGLDPDKVTNLGVSVALAGLVGAKLLMFVVDFDYYAKNPGEIFSMTTLQAGGVFYGGLLLALITGYVLMQRGKLPVAVTLDCFAPGLAIGQGLGRIGCFAAGCCWGKECERPWGVVFRNPEANRLTGVPLMVELHPTQIYEAVLYVATFFVVYRIFDRPHRPGTVMGWYLVIAATGRFVVEFFRFHQQSNPFGGPLNASQWIALALVGLGGWLVARGSRVPAVA
jgi:phosphatidylglycerol:prolipoprotein diacylglycerol transferase